MNDFNSIEKKWQERWEKAGIFKVKEDDKGTKQVSGPVSNKVRKKFYCLEMFPYPSGSGLHMGHVRNYAMGDCIARFKRMHGFNVLYPMGYDAFGLPAENAAIKNKSHPKIYTETSMSNIEKNQKALGLSYDWTRKFATCYPDYYKWNQWFFLQFLKKGLAYKKEAPVNWCPKCTSVLANEQVEDGKCWRCESQVEEKRLEQWFFKITDYADRLLKDIEKLEWPEKIKKMQENWIGKSEGAEICFKIEQTDKIIKTFSTRPDTIFGITYIVLAPDHPLVNVITTKEKEKYVEKYVTESLRKKEIERTYLEKEKTGVFTGAYALHPITKQRLPIWIADYVLIGYGTGAIFGTPAHDDRDFYFALKHNLPIVKVIEKPKSLDYIFINIHDEDKSKQAEFIRSLSTKSEPVAPTIRMYGVSFKEIGKIIHEFKSLNIGNSESYDLIRNGNNFTIDSSEGKLKLNFTEVYTGNGKHINSDFLDGLNNKEAIEKSIQWLEKNKKGRGETVYKLRDWLISRQRYWGTPIPIVYCDKCGMIPVPEKDLPILLPEKAVFTGQGNPLANTPEFVNTKCPQCGGKARRETDTMDTFVDSSWYFLRFCNPNFHEFAFDKKAAEYWMTVDQYIGGAEHAVMHLLYARFFTKVLKDMGLVNFDEPFAKLFNQGILYKNGHKMSKSFGNVVSQEEMSQKYGIDTARLFLLFVGSPEKEMEWSDKGVEGVFRFVNRFYRLLDDYKKGDGSKDKYIESKTHRTIKNATETIENFEFNKSIGHIMGFVNSLNSNLEYISEKVFRNSVEILSLLLCPFAPHLSEEVWEKLGNKPFVSTEKWPKFDPKKIDEKAEYSEDFSEKVLGDIKEILALLKIKKPKQVNLFVPEDWKYILFKQIQNLLSKTHNTGEIIKELMKDAEMKRHGNEVPGIVGNLVKDASKIPDILLKQKDELEILENSKKIFEKEFGCKIEILTADKSPSQRARKAEPGKPGIEVISANL